MRTAREQGRRQRDAVAASPALRGPEPDPELDRQVRIVRLRAERCLLARLNAGYGFADGRLASEIYLHDASARERLGGDPLRPHDTHTPAQSAVEAALAAAPAGPRRDSRLGALCESAGLDAAEAEILIAAVAHTLDRDTAALCRALTGGALTGDLLLELCPSLAGAGELVRALHTAGRLVGGALIAAAEDRHRPGAPGAAIAVNRRVLTWLCGDDRVLAPLDALVAIYRCEDAGAAADVFVADPVSEELGRIADRAARAGDAPALLLHGPDGAGKLAAARRFAAALSRDVIAAPLPPLIEAAGDGAEPPLIAELFLEARLRDAVLYLPGLEALVRASGSPAARALRGAASAHPGAILFATRDASLLRAPIERPYQVVEMPRPTQALRRRAWTTALAGARELDEADVAALAARYVVGPATIAEVTRRAAALSVARGTPLAASAIEEVLTRTLSLELGSFGKLVRRQARLDEMVVPDDVQEGIRDLVAMVRERGRILEDWGYARHLGLSRGVSALFLGSPGTGKTMAASVVAGELGLPMFRIDLASVISKWIGETEKNIARIFDEAHSAQALLLFDEADSLFGKRTEVKSSNDRYANVEVSYLLQRMESFDGITILTSNLESGIDTAFMRRFNFRIRFPDPDVEEREQLWRILLPPETGLADSADFTRLAEEYDMTGGHIRNAVVRAAVIAARDGRPVSEQDLHRGAHHEYFELGKVVVAPGWM